MTEKTADKLQALREDAEAVIVSTASSDEVRAWAERDLALLEGWKVMQEALGHMLECYGPREDADLQNYAKVEIETSREARVALARVQAIAEGI